MSRRRPRFHRLLQLRRLAVKLYAADYIELHTLRRDYDDCYELMPAMPPPMLTPAPATPR